MVETKGNHLDGSDSQNKAAIGNKWADKAGDYFAYFMVFGEANKPIHGAVSVGQFIDCLKQLGASL